MAASAQVLRIADFRFEQGDRRYETHSVRLCGARPSVLRAEIAGDERLAAGSTPWAQVTFIPIGIGEAGTGLW